MLPCLILTVFAIYVLWVAGIFSGEYKASPEYVKGIFIGFIISVFIFGFTALATSRLYDSTRFNVIAPASECTIKENGGKTTITYENNEYVVSNQAITLYKAPDKKSETIEISGERRKYHSVFSELIYKLYYMRSPETETTTITNTVNRSVYKQ